jgi:hypothetical protein
MPAASKPKPKRFMSLKLPEGAPFAQQALGNRGAWTSVTPGMWSNSTTHENRLPRVPFESERGGILLKDKIIEAYPLIATVSSTAAAMIRTTAIPADAMRATPALSPVSMISAP